MKIIPKIITIFIAFFCPVTTPGQDHAGGRRIAGEAERVVQEQLDAYNKGDLNAFLATYSSDIKIYTQPDILTLEGLSALRERYGKLFTENPSNHAALVNRIVQGRFVIDQEHVTGRANGQELDAVAIYEVKDGKIATVWFIR